MAPLQRVEAKTYADGFALHFAAGRAGSFALDANNRVALIEEPGEVQFAVRFAALRSIAYRPAAKQLEVTWRDRGAGGEDRQRWTGMNAELWNALTGFLARHPLPGVAVELRD